jgi:hypothetical protein
LNRSLDPFDQDLSTYFYGGIMLASYKKSLHAAFSVTFFFALGLHAYAQTGNSGSISGTVVDPTGAVVPNATVEIHNPVSHFDRSTTTDKSGNFSLPNIPFNPYHMTVTAEGFTPTAQDVDVRSVVPVGLKVNLQVSGSSTTVTVEAGGDLVENDSSFHSDIDRNSFELRGSPPIPMASSMDSATMRRIRSPSMASRLRTSKARCSRTRFRSIPFNRWKSSRARHPRNTEAKPAL